MHRVLKHFSPRLVKFGLEGIAASFLIFLPFNLWIKVSVVWLIILIYYFLSKRFNGVCYSMELSYLEDRLSRTKNTIEKQNKELKIQKEKYTQLEKKLKNL